MTLQMKSIISFQPSSLCIVSQGDMKPHFSSSKVFWLSNYGKSEAGCWFLRIHERNRRYSLQTRVTSTSLILAATSPPNSGDISVLFQTSAVMLLAYWIANFVVPQFILKDLEADKTNENRKQEEENLSDNQQGSTPGRRTSSSGQRRGFDNTRQ